MALNLGTLRAWWSTRTRRVSGRRPTRRTGITALDVEAGRLQVVQAALRGGAARVVRHTALPLDPSAGADPEDAAALGARVAAALGPATLPPGPVVMGVPRAQVLLRSLELPPADREDEIAAMVYLRLSRDLPFRLEEACVDFVVLPPLPRVAAAASHPARSEPPPGARPTRVLAAVVRRRTVEHYESLARAAGVKLTALGLRSLAGAQAALACRPEAATGCVALVTLQPQEVVFDVLMEGALVFSRVGELPPVPEAAPAAGAAPAAPSSDPGFIEVVRSLHSYEGTEGHGQVHHLLLTGTTGREAALAAALSRALGVPAEVLAPSASGSEVPIAPGALPPALPAVGLALGALEPGGLPFDFLHPRRPPVARDHRRLRRLAVAAAVLAVVLAGAGWRARGIADRERLRAQLQEQIRLGNQNLGAFRHVRSQARTLRDWSAGRRNWLDHLAVLSALLPPSRELYVTALSTTARNTLNLSVKTRSGEILDRLTATLRTAGYDVKAPAIMPATDRFGYRFQASLELEVPATLTNDLDALVVETRSPAPDAAPATPPPAAPPGTAAPSGANAPPAPPDAASPAAPPTVAPSAGPGEPRDPESRGQRMRRRRPEGGARE